MTTTEKKSEKRSKRGFRLPVLNDVKMTRRTFVKASVATAAVAGGTAMLADKPGLTPQSLQTASGAYAQGQMISGLGTSVTLNVNGKNYTIPVTARTTLTDALRNIIGLTGTKEPCNRGECGGCTVVLNGVTVYACTFLAIRAGNGQKIVTVEGLANGTKLHPLQMAYVKYDAMQCSFCIPGQLMAAYAFLNQMGTTVPTRDQIRAAMAGNICRCGTYVHQILAIQEAAQVTTGNQAAVVMNPVA